VTNVAIIDTTPALSSDPVTDARARLQLLIIELVLARRELRRVDPCAVALFDVWLLAVLADRVGGES
jgi:hypothetical protein